MKLFILGGYGNTGRWVTELLLKHTDVEIVVAGRSAQRGVAFASAMNGQYPRGRVKSVAVDASATASLKSALNGVDIFVNCATTASKVEDVARTVLDADVDWVDIIYSAATVEKLRKLEPDITARGRCFITQAGIHPGLPGVLVRLAKERIPDVKKVTIGMLIHQKGAATVESAAELLADLNDIPMEYYKDGGWRIANYKDTREIRFDRGFGTQSCIPMGLEELKHLPQELGIEELAFCGSGFNWFADWVVFPLSMGLAKVKHGLGNRLMGRLFVWSVDNLTAPPYGCMVTLEAEGSTSLRLVMFAEDGYFSTAAAVAALLKQVAGGNIRRPGLHLM